MDFNKLAKIVRGQLVDQSLGSYLFKGVSIDSRTTEEAQLFVAIKGENNDGHLFIDDVLGKNIAGVMVNRDYSRISEFKSRIPIIAVDDTQQSMRILAANYAAKVGAKYIAITGSNGKTTTKEFTYGMIKSVVDKTYRSPGNLNNLYGIPLAIFKMPAATEYAVLEYGISEPGEMTKLTGILNPDIGVITNVGPTHLETLGSVEGVAEAKLELADSMDNDKPVLINADDPVLIKAASKRNIKFLTFGVTNKADFTAEQTDLDNDGFPQIMIDNKKIKLSLFGEYQIYNALIGYAVCKVLGLNMNIDSLEKISYDFAENRGEIEYFNGVTIIADCYNANPVSMTSGLKSFKNYISNSAIGNRRSIVVIGDMLELGEASARHHQQIGSLLAELDFDIAFTVGVESRKTYETAINEGYDKKCILIFGDTANAGEALLRTIKRGDIIYFKASRGIALEKIITFLKGSAFRKN